MFYHKPCSLQTLGAARRGLNLPALFSRLFSRVCADPSSYSFSHIQEHSLCVPKHASWWVERVSFTLMPGPPIVNTFLKTFGMTGTPQREPRFAEVLDRDDEPVENGDGQSEAGHQGNIQLQHQYYEERTAREEAEGQVQDISRRLVVAQEQVAEFAQHRETEAETLLQQVESALSSLPSAVDPAIAAVLQGLQQKLAESVDEAAAFSAQQKADAERTKRTYSQAELSHSQNGDIEMKRHKEDSPSPSDGAMQEDDDAEPEQQPDTNGKTRSNFVERAKYIPLRLAAEERRFLRLLEAALSVSEYTDKVDTPASSWTSKSQRMHKQLTLICGILCGLVVAEDYKKGQQLVKDRHFKENAEFFQNIFEVGRRYKIMNPDKMRTEYGKMIYMLMDTAQTHVQELLDFNPVRRLRTVHSHLEEANGLALLSDPLMERATAEIVSTSRSRSEIQRDIKDKEKARATLAKRYRSRDLREEEILHCLYSISDNNSFLLFNRDPIDRMIGYLRTCFRPDGYQDAYSLGISIGVNGARLYHSHERQYHYVLQSLMLWREISHDMFKMWYLAESDLLRPNNRYTLSNTGQGLNRVQQALAVSQAMKAILLKCQSNLSGSWVGSMVVHMGDHNVPNALMFIDKYNQVPRILNPVVHTLDSLPELYKDQHAKVHIDSIYGSLDNARKTILVDFLRHGFDGSGADNFFDAGSCIDGRLTSLWQWASRIEKKPYYNIFKLAGFNGFDGDFQK